MTFFDQTFSVFSLPHNNVAAVMRMQVEAMALTVKRAQAYAALPGTLALCHSPADLAAAHQRFLETAGAQYSASFQKIASAAPALSALTATGDPIPAPQASVVKPARDYIIVPPSASAGPIEPVPAMPVDDVPRVRRERRSA